MARNHQKSLPEYDSNLADNEDAAILGMSVSWLTENAPLTYISAYSDVGLQARTATELQSRGSLWPSL